MIPTNSRGFLEFLYYEIGQQKYDFDVCGLWKNGEERISTKWKKYSEVIFPLDVNQELPTNINQRQILPCEVILDIEEKDKLEPIIQIIKKGELYYSLWFSGSRGYHISLLFDRDLTMEEKVIIIDFFGTDIQKSGDRTLIALEWSPHWKTGNPKELIESNYFNGDEIGTNHFEFIEGNSGIQKPIITKSNKTLKYD